MHNDILGMSEETEVSDKGLIEKCEECDQPLRTLEVSSVKCGLELSKKLLDYSDWQGNKELSQVITRIKDVSMDLQRKFLNSMKQSSIRSYLS